MPINLTDTMLRSALQLPPRPYADTYLYDNSPYFDLSRREVVAIKSLNGIHSAASHTFVNGTDYALIDGCIDWTISNGSGSVPDFGTPFTIEYTYSRLGSAAASTSMWMGNLWASQDLGSSFAYASTSAQGNAFADLATLACLCASAEEACRIMVSSEIDLAEKYRRGTVLVDDTKKTNDWAADAELWKNRYKRALILARGPVRSFTRTIANRCTLVFGTDYDLADLAKTIIYDGSYEYGPF